VHDSGMGGEIPLWARRVSRVARRTIKIYGAIDGEQRAASFAYYVLFSLFPLMALLLTFGSLFFSAEEVVSGVGGLLPLEEDQQKFVWNEVSALEHARGGISVISLLILLWCSLRFFKALVRGVNRAWHTVEIPWWQLPLKNIVMLIVIVSALTAGLLIPALLQGLTKAMAAAQHMILSHFPSLNLELIWSLLDWSRYLMGAAVLFYSFTMLYMLAPRKRVPFKIVWLPAFLATVALQFCQIAFVNWLPHFIDYGIYGVVGVVMSMLLWVYCSGIIIMICGCLSAALGLPEDGGEPAT